MSIFEEDGSFFEDEDDEDYDGGIFEDDLDEEEDVKDNK